MSTCRGLWRRPSFGEFVLPHLTDEQATALMDYDYPGNVRELLNVLERAVVFKAEDFAKLMYAKYGENVSSKAAAALKITRNTLRKYL